MADRIRIANKTQTETIDFLSGVFKFEDLAGVWPFLMGSDGITPLAEVFPLVGEDTNANLRAAQNALTLAFKAADAWARDKLLANSYWIEWNQNGENEKRSLILPGGRVNQVVAPGVNPMGNEETIRRLRMLIARHPLFETVASATDSFAEMSNLGGDVEALTLAAGTEKARIASITFEQVSLTSVIETIWAGIRPKYDAGTSFTPGWEIEASGALDTDTTLTTDANASGAGSNVAVTSFATEAGLVQRGRITVNDVLVSNYDHMRGNYLALLRYRTTAIPSTFGIQLRQGYSEGVQAEVKPPEYVTPATTDFYFVDLGIVTFPAGQIRGTGGGDMRASGIGWFAERLAGSGSLYWDRLIFIPADHMVKVDGALLSDGTLSIYTHEDDEMSALQFGGDSHPERNLVPEATNWYIPVIPEPGGQLVIAAVNLSGISVKTDTLAVDVEFVERWIDYRDS